ncbi:MAG: serine--tRNA ligase [Candidatus Dojkabacteria bacterium]|nr:MAG: serine--tRNA ligase [Candidatus Dojkabacteria bacterium]
MLDPKFIRENPEKVREAIRNKGISPEKADIDKWLALDKIRTELIHEIDSTNKRRNEIAKLISQGIKDDKLTGEGRLLKEREQELRENLNKVETEWNSISSWFPNIPLEDVPVGKDETENVEIYAWIPGQGELEKDKLGLYMHSAAFMPTKPMHADADFEPKHHFDILEQLGLIDMKQAAKVAGARFYYLIGDIVKLQRALHDFLLKYLDEKGFVRIIPPILVKEKVLFGTSHFPEGRDQVYEIKTDYIEEKDPLFLVGSSEPSNFAFAMDRVFKRNELPLKLAAITPCFRSEVGSWGKDVRGMKRVHQFDKLEMDVICLPEQSEDVYEELLSINKWLLQQLELPFHIIQKCTGDSGYNASAKQADVEVWLPSQKTFMEVGTDTNTTDFQARRMNIKFIDTDSNKKYAHTVNDTGVSDRMLIAIVEHYQQKDGSIKVPEVLVPLMRKKYIGK